MHLNSNNMTKQRKTSQKAATVAIKVLKDGRIGKHHVETMKLLAASGQGLGEYIENVVKQGYARQLR